MNSSKTLKVVTNTVYTVCIVIVLCLVIISLFGSNETTDSSVMINLTKKEQAFIWLALGTVPMFFVCMAVYKFNGIEKSIHRKRNFMFIFLPEFICSVCALYVIGVIILGMINTIVFQGELF